MSWSVGPQPTVDFCFNFLKKAYIPPGSLIINIEVLEVATQLLYISKHLKPINIVVKHMLLAVW